MNRLLLIYLKMPIYAGLVVLASFFLTLSILTWADAYQEAKPSAQIGVDV